MVWVPHQMRVTVDYHRRPSQSTATLKLCAVLTNLLRKSSEHRFSALQATLDQPLPPTLPAQALRGNRSQNAPARRPPLEDRGAALYYHTGKQRPARQYPSAPPPPVQRSAPA